jgi:predicted MFS family arabinose efflux permease
MQRLAPELRQYLLVTGNYWAFTLTDGALRMLVVLHFHQLGYSPLAVASLFLFYEFFGIVTNLLGGWLGARVGLNRTMQLGLGLQILALGMLTVPPEWLLVAWVMAAQALSGIAKDLNKMSAKSSIKLLVAHDRQATLYRWVARLTGSKNALKGVGFFLGGLLLTTIGFRGAMLAMAAALALIWLVGMFTLHGDIGRARAKPKFRELLSKSRTINLLSAARLFLFAARDVWFVVALPVFLSEGLGWDHWRIGGFLAAWVIGYGMVQALAPAITSRRRDQVPGAGAAVTWSTLLALATAAIALLLMAGDIDVATLLVAGLAVFGVLFAINSSLHSYLIVSHAAEDGVSLDVGFYYMANAAGRLLGTLLSGAAYQTGGLLACLWISAAFIGLAALLSLGLPAAHAARAAPRAVDSAD